MLEAIILPPHYLGMNPALVVTAQTQNKVMCKQWLCLALQASSHPPAGGISIV